MLVADVWPSSFGPYMIQFRSEHAYYTRSGTRTVPMSESQVRDSYALATRREDLREEFWQEHKLPISLSPREGPCLSVAGVPYEPRREYLPPLEPTSLGQFIPPHRLWAPPTPGENGLNSIAGVWADGVHRECLLNNQRMELFRVHRDGSVGLARFLKYPSQPPGKVRCHPVELARLLNWHLRHAGHIWSGLGVIGVGELRVELQQLDLLELAASQRLPFPPDFRGHQYPPDFAGEACLHLRREVFPWTLLGASERHDVVYAFAAKLSHAYGIVSPPDLGFKEGPLYAPQSLREEPVMVGALVGGVCFPIARLPMDIRTDGSLISMNGDLRGWVLGGVVVDIDGYAVAALEFARGPFLPPGFLVMEPADVPVLRGAPPVAGYAGSSRELPHPKRSWSEQSLAELLR